MHVTLAGLWAPPWLWCLPNSFGLTAWNHQVLYNGQLQSIYKVVESVRQKVPTVKIAYHQMTESPQEGKPGNFNLKRSHSIWYSPQSGNSIEEGNEEEQSQPSTGQQSAAKLVPNMIWAGHSTQIVFSVKYSPSNGITPIRPQIVLTCEIELKPGECAELFWRRWKETLLWVYGLIESNSMSFNLVGGLDWCMGSAWISVSLSFRTWHWEWPYVGKLESWTRHSILQNKQCLIKQF